MIKSQTRAFRKLCLIGLSGLVLAAAPMAHAGSTGAASSAFPQGINTSTFTGGLGQSGSSTGGGSCGADFCDMAATAVTQDLINQQHELTNQHITDEFKINQNWLMNEFFEKYVKSSLRTILIEHGAGMQAQAVAQGGFIDAQQQLKSQSAMAENHGASTIAAQPAVGVCSAATVNSAISNAGTHSKTTAAGLATYAQQRARGEVGTAGATGAFAERTARYSRYNETNCNPGDFGGNADVTCQSSDGRIAMDINQAALANNQLTLGDVNMLDSTTSETEKDFYAQYSGSFINDLPKRPNAAILAVTENQDNYMHLRSAFGISSIFETGAANITGLRSQGDPADAETGTHLRALAQQQGMGTKEAAAYLGENPSLFSLLKTAGQTANSPQSFVNYMDNPANVQRMALSSRGTQAIIDNIAYNTELDMEAQLAALVALELGRFQEATQSRSNWITKETDQTGGGTGGRI